MITSYLIYAAFDDKYPNVATACAKNDWVFVGKEQLSRGDTSQMAVSRVVAELSSAPGKHGRFLQEAISKSGAYRVQHLSTWTPASEAFAKAYPTEGELYWINNLQAAGGVIKNLAPKSANP